MNDIRRVFDTDGSYIDVEMSDQEQSVRDADAAEVAKENLRNEVLIALGKNDIVFMRSRKGGIPFNAEWQAYDSALRAVLSTGMGTLPIKPVLYPDGEPTR